MLLDFEKAVDIVRNNIRHTSIITIDFFKGIGYVLAEDVCALRDNPPHDNSAMDGFVFCYEFLKDGCIDVVKEEVKAGDKKTKVIKNKALRIYTGGLIPDGFDTVIEVENTEIKDDKLYIKIPVEKGRNIRGRGNDVKKGEVLLKKGTRIDILNYGLLLNSNVGKIKVYKKMNAGIVSTGNELKKPGSKLGKHNIIDTSSYVLKEFYQRSGIEKVKLYKVKDDLKKTEEILKKALKDNDIVLTIGGVSMGNYDFIRPALENIGAEKLFWRIALKPGRPLGFYKYGDKFIFTLPGNPVASFACSNIIVKPFINACYNNDFYIEYKKAVIECDWNDIIPRTQFIRGIYKEDNGKYFVSPAGQLQRSDILSELANSNCFMRIEANSNQLKKGDTVQIIVLK